MRFALVVFAILTCFLSTAQNLAIDWTYSIGGLNDDNITDIEVDNSENLVIGGSFEGTIDVDLKNNTRNVTSKGESDAILIKYDKNGNLIWDLEFGGKGIEGIHDVQIDSSDNIYVLGYFDDSISFNSSPIQAFYPKERFDVFLLKLDSKGNFKWVKIFESSDSFVFPKISSYNSDFIYVTASFNDTIRINNINQPTVTHAIQGNENILVAKFDSSGDYDWSHSIGSIDWQRALDAKADINGNIQIIGTFDGLVDFDPGPLQSQISSHNTSGFILSLDQHGIYRWVYAMKAIEGNNMPFAIDIKDNEIVASGRFSGESDFSEDGVNDTVKSVGTDAFILKIDTNGQHIWTNTISNQAMVTFDDVELTSSGTVYALGVYNKPIYFQKGSITDSIVPHSVDPFVAHIDAQGILYHASTFYGAQIDRGTAIIESNNRIYIAGNFQDFIDMDVSSNSHILRSNGENDGFILKSELRPLAINKLAGFSEFLIYPNPSSGQINLTSSAPINEIIIFSSLGELVYQETFERQTSSLLTLPSSLDNGLYFVGIETINGIETRKLILKRE